MSNDQIYWGISWRLNLPSCRKTLESPRCCCELSWEIDEVVFLLCTVSPLASQFTTFILVSKEPWLRFSETTRTDVSCSTGWSASGGRNCCKRFIGIYTIIIHSCGKLRVDIQYESRPLQNINLLQSISISSIEGVHKTHFSQKNPRMDI